MLIVECMRQQIQSGTSVYPVYIGFLPAVEISKVAEAPAFTTSTQHQQIAANVSNQPVKDWQRPLDTDRIDGIADAFDDTGNLMPNPILLGQNAFKNGAIAIAPKATASGQLTGTYEVQIDDTGTQPGQLPLWILDGQHRVAGLAQSKQNGNPVPVVFLLDDGSGAYSSPLLASLFAQVTTSATKLDDLHNEWLTYAFGLGRYGSAKTSAKEEGLAFATVIELCRTPTFHGQGNPFLNAIQFNEHVPWQPTHGGFKYQCTALKSLVFKYYYNQPTTAGHLSPGDLASQIAMAYSDLWAVMGTQANSVFFGQGGSQQSIMHDAYIAGVLARLLTTGAQTTWKTLLQSLAFHTANWDFSWIRSLSGPANTASKKIATSVMSEAMSTGALPSGSSNIPDHLRGNGATLTLQLSSLTAAGRPRRQGRITQSILRGSTQSINASQHPHLKVTGMSSNVGKLEVVDATKPGRPVHYDAIQRRGLILQGSLPNPLELMFIMTHYGNLTNQAELQVTW